MISEILKRNFVLNHLENDILPALEQESTKADDTRRGEADLPDVSKEQILEAAIHLRTILEAEKKATASESAKPAMDTGTYKEDFTAYVSSTPELGMLQSIMEERYDAIAKKNDNDQYGNIPRDDEGIPVITDKVLDLKQRDGTRVFNEFSQTDLRWISCMFTQTLSWFRNPEKFPLEPSPIFKMADNARLIIVGDWGSGLERALEVKRRMIYAVAKAREENREVHVIHLGDIYYSGTEKECEKHFLDPWPVASGQPEVYSWCLNANHDMFSGGRGYFRKVLKDERFANQAGSNRFELSHKYWTILGLDTAYFNRKDNANSRDHRLAGDQPEWVEKRLKDAHANGKKGLLLSHHQLFSAYESQGNELKKQLASVLEKKLVRAWFWGHEHRLCAYHPHQGVQHARCIGHGGVPVYQTRDESDSLNENTGPDQAPLLWEYRGSYLSTLNLERWALFGFACVDMKDDKLVIKYVHEKSKLDPATQEYEAHFKEVIS